MGLRSSPGPSPPSGNHRWPEALVVGTAAQQDYHGAENLLSRSGTWL